MTAAKAGCVDAAQGGIVPPASVSAPVSAQEWREILSGPPADAALALERAAREGVAVAQLHYGQRLLDGHGVAADPRAALRWFHAAAQGGLAMAMNMIGRCLDQGWGTPEDPAAAAPWFRAAADRGLDWGMYNLATLMALGRGVAQDRAAALDLFRRAGALGHAKSLGMIGSFYEDGWAVSRDMKMAAHFYARAAQGDDFRGCFNHARMLLEAGRHDEAQDWIERARAAGTPRFAAQLDLWLAQNLPQAQSGQAA